MIGLFHRYSDVMIRIRDALVAAVYESGTDKEYLNRAPYFVRLKDLKHKLASAVTYLQSVLLEFFEGGVAPDT